MTFRLALNFALDLVLQADKNDKLLSCQGVLDVIAIWIRSLLSAITLSLWLIVSCILSNFSQDVVGIDGGDVNR